MATRKQTAAASRNIKKAAAAAERRKTISHLPAKTRAFIDFLAESFGPEPYWDKPITRT